MTLANAGLPGHAREDQIFVLCCQAMGYGIILQSYIELLVACMPREDHRHRKVCLERMGYPVCQDHFKN